MAARVCMQNCFSARSKEILKPVTTDTTLTVVQQHTPTIVSRV